LTKWHICDEKSDNRPMKILLIKPCEFNFISAEMPEVLEKNIGFSPPLGLLYLAASILSFTNWDVEVIDAVAEQLSYDQLASRIKTANPDLIGISAMTQIWIDCLKTAEIAKKVLPETKIILGGPHPHIYPQECLDFDCIDYVIMGEGEKTIVELLDNFSNDEAKPGILGLGFKDNEGKPIVNQQRDFDHNLDAIPMPNRRLLDINLYSTALTGNVKCTTMITSRGCPYKCTFCDRPNLGKVFRARSAKNVVDEMEDCKNLGIDYIKIYDDTFTIDRIRVLEICRELKERKLNIQWDMRARVNTVDKEMLLAMKKAGCCAISYGIESGNEEIIMTLQKGIKKEQAVEVFQMTKEAGIKILAYFMFGCPSETLAQMQETIDFSIQLDADYCHYAILVPFPATPLYLQGLKDGFYTFDYWREFVLHPTKDFKPKLWLEHVSEKDLHKIFKKAYNRFYMRPAYIWKRLKEVKSPAELINKAKIAFGISRIK